MIVWILLAVAYTCNSSVWCRVDPPDKYTNEWVIQMEGGPEEAQLLALDTGYKFLGEVKGMKNTYRLERPDHPKRLKRNARHLTKRLADDERVFWVEQQEIRKRQKRDFTHLDTTFFTERRKRPSVGYEDTIDLSVLEMDLDEENPDVESNELNVGIEQRTTPNFRHFLGDLDALRSGEGSNRRFNDELWGKQWYLHKNGITKSDTLHMNVLPCYDMGLSGRGIRVLVLDDGIEANHTDLQENYDAMISYDMNGEDEDPTPQYNNENEHGTRCAGEVAMTANNYKCGVGVAFNAKIGGIRMLDGPVTDRIEAASLVYAHHLVDIFSASWGPKDDGQTLDGPGKLMYEAFLQGIKEGRNGKGSIFIWASGNGGGKHDSCSCDGYVNSVYTLTVSSATQRGKFPWYGEKCAATMTTTYSSGARTEEMVISTDLGGKCTEKHSGTSASAPIAAGIIALMLEARPDLTWRDVQHIVVRTSRPEPLLDNTGWQFNSAGLMVNTQFGFGLMDAHAMVLAAKAWVPVPPRSSCNFSFEMRNETLTPGKSLIAVLPTYCSDVRYLEHVQLGVNIFSRIRGALEVYLTSPEGTKIQILYQRALDKSGDGFQDWQFMSVLTWNENPEGNWRVEILDTCKICTPGHVGNMMLTLHGSKEPPHYITDDLASFDHNEVDRESEIDISQPSPRVSRLLKQFLWD